MKDQTRTNQELIDEISALKKKNKELEHSESERKRAEDALRESEEWHKTILQTAMDGIWWRTGKVICWQSMRPVAG